MPIAPPIRCSTFICGVASESCSGRSAEKAALIAGMKRSPMPTPRTSSTTEIARIEVFAPMNASGSVPTHRNETPPSATRPPPKRAVRRPASGIASSIPRPCGPVSRPVMITLSRRTSW